ncbi:MAG: hypothetical protein QQN63_08110 [Nitrosopumilus sp.]
MSESDNKYFDRMTRVEGNLAEIRAVIGIKGASQVDTMDALAKLLNPEDPPIVSRRMQRETNRRLLFDCGTEAIRLRKFARKDADSAGDFQSADPSYSDTAVDDEIKYALVSAHKKGFHRFHV